MTKTLIKHLTLVWCGALVLAGCPGDDSGLGAVDESDTGGASETADDSASESASNSNSNSNSNGSVDDTTTDPTDPTEDTTTDPTDPTNETTADPSTSESTTEGSFCGDGVADPGEDCDGIDLAGETCMSQGFDAGNLACTRECLFETTKCTNVEDCGNGAIDDGEDCDGNDLADQTCMGLGHDGGQLACAVDCTFDESACTDSDCGNGAIDAGEDCDGAALGGQTCMGLGHDGGNLGCNADCTFDEANCFTNDCGNGAIDAGEDCDGANLNGASCASLGFTDGTLSCDAGCAYDTTQCTAAPPGWTCPPGFYDAADGCDCGCGVEDPDCPDNTAASCDFCNESGSCAENLVGCNAIDPEDNSTCGPPDGWTCAPGFYGTDDGCDCGCGAFDPDCADETAASCQFCNDLGSCDDTGQGCPGEINPNDNSICVPPDSWTCNDAFYGTDDGCDCGCGAVDPDCADNTTASCQFCNDLGSCDGTGQGCPGIIDPNDNSTCAGAPPEWTCNDAFYGADDGCDCGCGVQDPDCPDLSAASCEFCNETGSCADAAMDCAPIQDNYNPGCEPPPAWTCAPGFYGTNDGCDCGCGVTDPDCADTTAASCQYCNDVGSCDGTGQGCPGIIDANDNSTCQGGVAPANWTCADGFYGTNDGCDCGCGAQDPDCADGSSGACQFCNEIGSCDDNGAGCPGEIHPMANWQCNGAPDQWTCNAAFYGTDDGCDCGCGVFDPDCSTTDPGVCEFCNNAGSCTNGGGCGALSSENWHC